ncbi:MAG: 23S rRNA (adenine(2503)-C(2))-methyltransferase RlmN [Acidobacteriota bacterium]
MSPTAENLFGLTEDGLREKLARLDSRGYQAGQIFRWMYGRGVTDFRAMTNLPLPLRETLGSHFRISCPIVDAVVRAADGTTKYTVRLEDGERVETILIPEGKRLSICVSSQVGCALECRFCMTATMGLRRNLTAGEIVGQVWLLRQHAALSVHPLNIILMGMGEPMQNLPAVMDALRLLADERTFNIPYRRVTLSTAGHVPGIRKLATYPERPRLAVSLTATTDKLRNRLMPINRRYPIGILLETLRGYPLGNREKVTFEYVLLAGVNDSVQDADRLAKLTHGLRCKVNLIRFNRTDGSEFIAQTEERVKIFRDRLRARKVSVTLRKQKGEEIFAACGQLALRRSDPSAATDPSVKAGGS